MLAAVLHGTSLAQPVITFKGIDMTFWPGVEASFTVTCDGNSVQIYPQHVVSLKENGVPVKDFYLSCPQPSCFPSFSVATVFDASASMAGAYSAGAKEGGHAFVALNQSGGRSESAIIWFNSTVHVQQAMTKDKALLHAAVDSIPAEGGSALWDGVWAGIEELYAHGSAGSYMLILLTDGADSSSAHSLAEVIAFARNTIFRVYAIGIGRNVDSVSLQLLSDTTDGRYFAVADPGDLPTVYRTICSDFDRPFEPCTLFYQSKCLGDTLRTLELSISNVCGDSASASMSFPAPGVPIIQGPRAACPNTPLWYSVTDHPGSWYRWEARGGTIIQGGGSSSVLISWPHGGEGPAGTVIIREETDYCSAVDSLQVTRLRSAFPVIDALGPTQFCLGDSVILDAGAGWDYYRWSTGWPTGDTTRRIVVKKSGSYSVETGWYAGCGDMSLPVTVTVFPKASIPTILRRGDTLRCGMAAVSYTWMRNGVPLSIGNTSEFVFAETGTYTVMITNANGCSSTSPPFIVTTLPVEKLPPDDLVIEWYPQPVRGDFTVRIGNGNAGSMLITIMDILGRTLLSKTVDIDKGGSVLIPFDEPLPGVYILTVENGTRRISLPFLKVQRDQ